jgi:secondary thiamine-phosphate synthase enzyme
MEHPILFLDLLTGAFNLHVPPHITYTWFVMLLLLGLGFLASRSISLVPAGAQNVFELIISGLEEFMVDITGEVQSAIRDAGIRDGLCMVFVPHTTAAVTINENADPTVKDDMLKVLNKVIPWDDGYRHLEGNSASPYVLLEVQGKPTDVRVLDQNGKLITQGH